MFRFGNNMRQSGNNMFRLGNNMFRSIAVTACWRAFQRCHTLCILLYTLNMLRQHINRKAKQTHNQSAVLCHLQKRKRCYLQQQIMRYPFAKAIATVALLNNNNAICIARHLCGIILFMRSHLAYDTLTSRLLFRHSRGRRSLAN